MIWTWIIQLFRRDAATGDAELSAELSCFNSALLSTLPLETKQECAMLLDYALDREEDWSDAQDFIEELMEERDKAREQVLALQMQLAEATSKTADHATVPGRPRKRTPKTAP